MKYILSVSLLSLACISALAAEPVEANLPNGHFSLGFGTFSAKAYERVYGADFDGLYDPNYKLSQLDWRVKNALTINSHMDVRFLDRFEFQFSTWFALDDSTDTIKDYDWLDETTSQPSHRSSHDCVLESAYGVDASIGYYFLENETYAIGIMAGFEQIKFSMSAVGGSGSYWFGRQNWSVLGDYTGMMYEQKYQAPYVGLMGSVTLGQFDVEARVKYSAWASCEDNDRHIMRMMEFWEECENQQYLGVALTARWNVTERWGIAATVEYRQFDEERANIEVIDQYAYEMGSFDDGASMESSMLNLSLSTTYAF